MVVKRGSRVGKGNGKGVGSIGGKSSRGVTNMTRQLKTQLQFLNHNLVAKERELKYASRFVGKVPGAKAMVDINKRGIKKVRSDITKLKLRIRKLQREGKIEKIL